MSKDFLPECLHSKFAHSCARSVILSFLFLSVSVAQALAAIQSPAATQTLQIGLTIHREISGGDLDSYMLPLDSGQYFSVRVEQLGVDVIVAIYGPDGRLIEEFDSPNGDRAP